MASMILIVLALAAAIGYLAHLSRVPQGRPIRQPFIGELYLPRRQVGSVPGVVVLHGSEGYAAGSSRVFADALAKHGIVALALCYFGCPGRPSTLHHIEIDDVFRAIAYMDSYPGVKRGDVTLIGFSRGGELALLAGSYDREPRAVIAYYGSPTTWGSYPGGAPGAWLMHGVALPTRMVIPVYRIRGPVELFVGAKDHIWPARFSREVAAELSAFDHPYHLVVFPNAGHAFGGPWQPRSLSAQRLRRIGGTLAGHNRAGRVSFSDTLAFIRSLKPAYAPGPHLPAVAAAPVPRPVLPLPDRLAEITVPVLVALIILWATGVEPDPRSSAHPWLLRWLEPPWSEWDQLDWEARMRIARTRQAVSWVFAVLGAACIFVPLIATLA